MAELVYIRLDDDAVAEALKGLSGWIVRDGKLTKEFNFDAYLAGIPKADGLCVAA